MIQFLALKHQKNIAFSLLILFYCEIILTANANACYRPAVYRTGDYHSPAKQYRNDRGDNYYDDFASYQSGLADSAALMPESNTTAASADSAEDFTSGPTQPEMQSFQSVNSNNMVDLFTGDFSYNIPLMDVGGYPVNISYRSGISMDQEASWVGLGWNINPGTITRNMRGVPDDFNGVADTIKKTNSVKENKTIGVTGGINLEVVGFPKIGGINLGGSLGVFHNTYHGWGTEFGLDASIRAGVGAKGTLTGGLSINDNSQNGLTISPSLSVKLARNEADNEGGLSGTFSTSTSYNSRSGLKALNFSAGVRQYVLDKKSSADEADKELGGREGNFSAAISFATPSVTPTISMPYTSTQYTFTAKIGAENWSLHPNFFLSGYMSSQVIKPEDQVMKLPAYGYLHYQDGAKNPSGLLDFNREKEIPYRDKPALTNIAIPGYTYDVFSIKGEGTGGMFRAYRSDIGAINDHYIKTKDNSDGFSADVGIGNIVHAGLDININSSYTQNNAWQNENPLRNIIAFRDADSTFENSYFRNPGEKAINAKSFYDAVGGDDVVTASLFQPGNNNPVISTTSFLSRYRNKRLAGTSQISASNVVKTQRDKRTQVISYLNAAEAGVAGLSKSLENYLYNNFIVDTCNGNQSKLTLENRINSFRKASHISEINVLNADGRRYVYGIPVYNLKQKDVTFSVDYVGGNFASGIVKYNPSPDATVGNNQGMDHYFTSEEIPAYAHSFLLTGVLSPDYVDLTGDGISDDDLGDAVKFNYTKVAGSSNPYKWRTPYTNFGEASYNEGLKTDNRDDKGSYVYGEKELWYLNTIQSKTMMATFKLEDRKDLLPIDEDGNKDTTNNNHNGSKLLREINLYSKADYLKNGSTARPIKTVHFEYTYELCKGVNYNKNIAGSVVNYSYKDSGKLTLKKIWFTYNGDTSTKKLNPYIFNYHSNNPAYSTNASDRWGNYKDPAFNPNGLPNSVYPYTQQDSANEAKYVAAWTLDSIVLPSAGRIKVSYESDDYAYVQNKRAMQMFKIVGLAPSPGGTPTPTLYSTDGISQYHTDNLFVVVHASSSLSSKQDVYFKYLEGVNKLYFKLFVTMPSDKWGSGSEYVPCYADIDTSYSNGGYGLIDGNNFWVKMKGISLAGEDDGEYSPLAKAAIQFLRLNLPSKAYPGSDVGDNVDVKDAVNMIFALGRNFSTAFRSYDTYARNRPCAYQIDTGRSFVRLDNPNFKRYGGGLRVKSVKIYDHWNAMTGQKESTYGQFYDYTTTKEINGVVIKISSGVASYEPMVGGEENPFHVPLRYEEKSAPLAPVTLGYVEEPLGETFFPSADVGYSKVRMRSIHTVNKKSANGYEETAFYTAYDFPTMVDNTMIDDNTKKRYKPALANFLKIDAKHYLTLSQGFKIELNDMHGKMKYQATYAETDPVNPISYTENFYKVDDPAAEFKHLANTAAVIDAKGNIDTTVVIGKDVEVMMDMREQLSEVTGNNVSPNVDIFMAGLFPVVLPSLWYLPQHEENLYRSVATTKIIQRYGILDSVVHIDKGSKVSTKNMAYDSETGDVLLTRTNNEFNDPIYNFTYPAHWAYSGMGPAYKNIDAIFRGITIHNGIPQSNVKYPNLMQYFESGDEILVNGRLKVGEIPPVPSCDGVQGGCNIDSFASNYDTAVIWAVNVQKMSNTYPASIVFIDKYGKPYSATDLSMKIIRSGRRNMPMTPVGSVTLLKNPVQVVSGKLKIAIDSTDNIIAAGAAIFDDLWRVSDSKSSNGVNCYDVITDTLVNPYTAGLYGNWRTAKTYVYYGQRAEKDPSAQTDIRKNGTIAGFIPYWTFGSTYLQASSDTTRWVWNAQTTLFNKKGFELENKDPLGRYNSGKYGYNNTLPVSVTQNSRYREQFFDGLEDYYYKDQNCTAPCPVGRETALNQSRGTLDTVFRHTGKYSLKIAAHDSSIVTIPVTAVKKDVVPQVVTADFSAKKFGDTTVTPMGTGLPITHYVSSQPDRYDGYIQPLTSGFYSIESSATYAVFSSGLTPGYTLSVNGVSSTVSGGGIIGTPTTVSTYLLAGQKYPIIITTASGSYFTAPPTLRWSKNGGATYTSIPSTSLYATNTADGSFSSAITTVKDTLVFPKGHGLAPTTYISGHISGYGSYLQVNSSGLYTITSTISGQSTDDSTYAYGSEINGPDLISNVNNSGGSSTITNHVYLKAGIFYSLLINAAGSHGNYFTSALTLKWQKCDMPLTDVPTVNLYSNMADTSGTVVVNDGCIQLKGIYTDSSSLIPAFSPLQGATMWLSGWVRENRNCLCQSYTGNQVKLVFTDSAGSGIDTLVAKPSGLIIEGWQRYDYTFTIPANAANLSYRLLATDTVSVNFDDLRIHPFNANMKSFVYDPVNLRLMAELDENNYATFYEYDDDGTLVRVKKETQKGIQTIKETRSYLTKYSTQ